MLFGPSVVGMAVRLRALSHAAIAKGRRAHSCDIRDGNLIHSASRIKRASRYDAILRLLDQ